MKKLKIILCILSLSFVFSEDQKYPNGIYSKDYDKIRMRQEPISIDRKIMAHHNP